MYENKISENRKKEYEQSDLVVTVYSHGSLISTSKDGTVNDTFSGDINLIDDIVMCAKTPINNRDKSNSETNFYRPIFMFKNVEGEEAVIVPPENLKKLIKKIKNNIDVNDNSYI